MVGEGIRLRLSELVTRIYMAHTPVFRASPGHWPVLPYRQADTVGILPREDGSESSRVCFYKGEQSAGFPLDPEPLCVWEHGNDLGVPPGGDTSHCGCPPLRTKPRWKSGSSAALRRQKPSETWSDMHATSSRNSGGPSTTNITFPCLTAGVWWAAGERGEERSKVLEGRQSPVSV